MHVQLRPEGLDHLVERVLIAGLGRATSSVLTVPSSHHRSTYSLGVCAPVRSDRHPARRKMGATAQFRGPAVSTSMRLKHKVAVIYGAGGAIGGAVAHAFASEGAVSSSPAAPSHPLSSSPGTSLPRADRPRRRRSTRSTSRPLTNISGPWSIGQPHRHLVQRDRHPEPEDPRAPRRPRRRAVLGPDRDLHEVVLPDRSPRRPTDGPGRSGGDHDRHRDAFPHRRPLRRRRRSCDGGRGGAHTGGCRPSSHPRGSAWSVCDRRASRRRIGSGTASRPTPRHRG